MYLTLLLLIFLRPFLSSLAFPYANLGFSLVFISALTLWYAGSGHKSVKLNNLKTPFILFFITALCSIIFSLQLGISLPAVHNYAVIILVFLFGKSLFEDAPTETITFLFAAAIIISFMGIYQYLWGFQRVTSRLTDTQGVLNLFLKDYLSRKRVFFPFVTPNILGGYLAMILPFAFIKKGWRWAIVPIALAIMLSASLGAILTLLVTLGLLQYLRGGKNKRVALLTGGIFAAFIVILLYRLAAPTVHTQPEYSIFMRWKYWKASLEVIKAHPILGLGIGNFNMPYSRFAHNAYLQIWAEMGIFGITAFLWLILKIFKSAIIYLKEHPREPLFLCLLTSWLVFLIHNIFEFSFFLPEVNTLWWLISGMLVTRIQSDKS